MEFVAEHNASRTKRTCPASEAEKAKITNSKNKFNCVVCNWETKTAFLLKGHMTKQSDMKCSTCDLQFKTMGLFRRHMKTVHQLNEDKQNTQNNKEGEVPVLNCSVCGLCASNSTHLKNHQMSQHGGHNVIYCGLCDFKSETKSQHMKHMKVAMGHKQKKAENKANICEYLIETHVTSHTPLLNPIVLTKAAITGKPMKGFLVGIKIIAKGWIVPSSISSLF